MKRLWIAGAIVAGSAVAGCGSSDPVSDIGAHFPRFRAVQAVPDAGGLDFYVDDGRALTNGQFTQVSDYRSYSPGNHLFEVTPSGSRTAIAQLTAGLGTDASYTLFIVNRLATIEAVLLTDSNAPPEAGQAKLRLMHAAPSAGALDIYATATGADLSGATLVLTGVAFKAATSYVSVPAGDYQIRATSAGTKTVTMDTGPVTLSAGAIRTVFAVDAVGGGAPYRLLLAADRD